MNKSLCLLLVVVAGLLTFPASLAAWEDRLLISKGGFVDIGNEVMSRPEIQEELSKEITAQVSGFLDSDLFGLGGLLGGPSTGGGLLGQIPGANELTGLLGSLLGEPTPRPSAAAPKPTTPAVGGLAESLIQPIVLETIADLPNSETGDLILEATHDSVIAAIHSPAVKVDGNTIRLNLDLVVDAVLKDIGLNLGPTAPGEELGEITLLDPTDIAPVFRTARFLEGKTMILALLPLGALALAFAVAPKSDRRLMPIYAGAAIAGSALLWILVTLGPLKPWVTNRVAKDESERRVANAAYDVIGGSFVNQEIMVLAVGAAILIAGIAYVTMSRRGPTRAA